jgi:hypothetical protein
MSFPNAPSPYSISPEAFIALSKLNLQPSGQSQGTPVSSYGLTQGQPAAAQSNTQQALQSALQNALSGGSGLQGLVQGLLNNPTQAQAVAGSQSPLYTPTPPAGAWRQNFDAPGGWGGGMIGQNMPLFPTGK